MAPRKLATEAAAPKTRAKAAPPAAGTNFPDIKDKKVVAMAEEYAAGAAEKSRIEKRLKVIKPVLEAAMGGAPVATAGSRVLTRGEVAAIPGVEPTTITPKMVGQVLPGKNGRAGYSTLEVR